ncbi:MAG: polyprenyl synthetase family protein [Fusobacteria bacterium]|nr:polyprenyl synthetase family protein [Fusobacteriota bacterium]
MSLEFMKEYEALVNKRIETNINKIIEQDMSNSEISQGMKYSLMAGGKRIRPIFCILGAIEAGLEPDDIIDFAVGIEFIHTYSLVHDDLPVMDDDNLRRGQPTCHIKYGEGLAILIGDALLTHGIRLMLADLKKVSLENQFKAVRILLGSIGVDGMIGGQGGDLVNEKNKNHDLANKKAILKYIHENKTSKLLEASLLSGGILGVLSIEDQEKLKSYGKAFGLAFQITDDILDLTSTNEELGKPVGSDTKNEKLTYPNVYGLEESKNMAEKILDDGIEKIKDFKKINKYLTELAEYLLLRKK